MKIFRFGTVIALLASLSTTSLFSEIFTLNTCLEETFSSYGYFMPEHEDESEQINLETDKYLCNGELDIDNEILDKTTYINNYEYFHSKNFSPTINNNLPELVPSDGSFKISNITKLLYLLNSSFLI